ncbi:MAG: hypothetical protein M3R62_09855 [Acidobacteriota bacterium]|nr:hypothetical protein [Acidobacteriota bacterium]
MTFKVRGIVLGILGLAGLAIALLNVQFRFLGLAVGFIFLFLAGTVFSKASRIANSLRPFVQKPVRVEVWGLPLPASGEALFEVDSIAAFGAGLLIHLRATSGGPRSLLKVAQPGSARLEDGRIEIGEAAYVSWAGTKLKPGVGGRVPAVVLLSRPNGERRQDAMKDSSPVS